MENTVPAILFELAARCKAPLYLVGGSVRDFLIGFSLGENPDWDLSSPASEDEVLAAAAACGFSVRSVFRNTGTVKLEQGGVQCEFTRFRSDKYVRGEHAPSEISFTDDILTDARRRDFTANAVYYNLKDKTFCDPLGGIADIKNKMLRTVVSAEKVFGEDGLRLLRLARIAAQTGFSPDKECLKGAKVHAALIGDIVPERIYAELDLLLHSDLKHGDKYAPYRGLCILRDSGVLQHILPELALGDKMEQRKDFHNHDVLEHSFRAVLYAPPEIRFAALLHDCGKPFCYLRDGNFHAHAEEGAILAENILRRLKAPKKLTERTKILVAQHMRDVKMQMRETGVRRVIVEHYPLFSDLLALMQADYSACKDDLSPAPAVVKWKAIFDKMGQEGAPRTLRELNIKGAELQALGVAPADTGRVLNELLLNCAYDGTQNTHEKLVARVLKLYVN